MTGVVVVALVVCEYLTLPSRHSDLGVVVYVCVCVRVCAR